MEAFIEQVCARLKANAFLNEAAVSFGVVVPLLRKLGWDETDPDQLIPEFSSGRGRVDFALCGMARRPSIFIEVKGVGRSLDGDRQLFEYAFHEGVPVCLLTDGREWSFYVPSGQGSYDDRRVYRLQLDERTPAECARVFERYLHRDRVRSGAALEDALKDYRDAASRREASRNLPQAWAELVAEPDQLLVELLEDRAEALCGFRPSSDEVAGFLRSLAGTADLRMSTTAAVRGAPTPATRPAIQAQAGAVPTKRAIEYVLLGEARNAPNANAAFVEILYELAQRHPDRLTALAAAVRGSRRNHIARTVEEIYPARPDLARAAEIAPGWLVGLNIANREKAAILRTACDVFGLSFGTDVKIDFPNA